MAEPVAAAFEQLPTVMSVAEARAAQVERAVVDLAEAVMLQGQEGTIFPAVPRHRGTQGQALYLIPATGNQLFILFIDVPAQKGDGTVSLQKGVGKRETPAQMAATGP